MKTMSLFFSLLMFFSLFLFGVQESRAQNDVMMQAFYWNVPYDTTNQVGFWWDTLSTKASALKQTGFTAVWTPPPSKGAWGIQDNGYGIFDHYDLGEYLQAGNHAGVTPTVDTRFGSKQDLLNMVNQFHQSGLQVYSDIVLNHIMGGNYEYNPSVKYYVEQQKYPSYPTSTLRWVLPNAPAGDYYIDIVGFNLNWNNISDCAYQLNISWTSSPDPDTSNAGPGSNPVWEYEPNNGSGQYNVFPGNGSAIWGQSNYQGDVDEFKVTLSSQSTVIMQLIPMYDNSGQMTQNSDDHGYRVSAVWNSSGQNLYPSLELRTFTSFSYAAHDVGIPQWTWNYQSFHPVDSTDFLQDAGYQDEVRPNWMLFGPDFNTYDPGLVQPRLEQWGQWLTSTVGYDGYRFDFVRGIQEYYIADWLKAMPLLNGVHRFAVGEYWTTYKYRLYNWVDSISTDGASCSVFDFPLRFDLARMCNGESGFQMSWLNHSGMVRDQSTPLQPNQVVTFLENHDTGKDPSQWISQDKDLGYAFILFAQGRPCIFYPDYYEIPEVDASNPSIVNPAEAGLHNKINQMIFIRNRYLGGGMQVLTEVGNPYPASDTTNVFIARREGDHATHPGAILVLNNSFTDSLGTWVTTNISGWPTLTNHVLYDLTNPSSPPDTVQGDSRVQLFAGARGYNIYSIDTTFVPVNFTVNNAYTVTGQNVYLVGSIQELGNWDPTKALGPFSAANYPTWTMNTIYLPPHDTIQYKYIIKDGSGNVTWEPGNNHIYVTPNTGTGSVNDNWGGGNAAAKKDPANGGSVVKLPIVYRLYQNYPNPFNPSTVIAYDIPIGKTVNVSIVIYNLLGQKVRTLVDETRGPGSYQVTWDGMNYSGLQVPSGVYLYRINAGNFVKTGRMLLLK